MTHNERDDALARTTAVAALVDEKLTVAEFTEKAHALGTLRVVLPGDFTTANVVPNGMRCYVTVEQGLVTSVTFG